MPLPKGLAVNPENARGGLPTLSRDAFARVWSGKGPCAILLVADSESTQPQRKQAARKSSCFGGSKAKEEEDELPEFSGAELLNCGSITLEDYVREFRSYMTATPRAGGTLQMAAWSAVAGATFSARVTPGPFRTDCAQVRSCLYEVPDGALRPAVLVCSVPPERTVHPARQSPPRSRVSPTPASGMAAAEAPPTAAGSSAVPQTPPAAPSAGKNLPAALEPVNSAACCVTVVEFPGPVLYQNSRSVALYGNLVGQKRLGEALLRRLLQGKLHAQRQAAGAPAADSRPLLQVMLQALADGKEFEAVVQLPRNITALTTMEQALARMDEGSEVDETDKELLEALVTQPVPRLERAASGARETRTPRRSLSLELKDGPLVPDGAPEVGQPERATAFGSASAVAQSPNSSRSLSLVQLALPPPPPQQWRQEQRQQKPEAGPASAREAAASSSYGLATVQEAGPSPFAERVQRASVSPARSTDGLSPHLSAWTAFQSGDGQGKAAAGSTNGRLSSASGARNQRVGSQGGFMQAAAREASGSSAQVDATHEDDANGGSIKRGTAMVGSIAPLTEEQPAASTLQRLMKGVTTATAARHRQLKRSRSSPRLTVSWNTPGPGTSRPPLAAARDAAAPPHRTAAPLLLPMHSEGAGTASEPRPDPADRLSPGLQAGGGRPAPAAAAMALNGAPGPGHVSADAAGPYQRHLAAIVHARGSAGDGTHSGEAPLYSTESIDTGGVPSRAHPRGCCAPTRGVLDAALVEPGLKGRAAGVERMDSGEAGSYVGSLRGLSRRGTSTAAGSQRCLQGLGSELDALCAPVSLNGEEVAGASNSGLPAARYGSHLGSESIATLHARRITACGRNSSGAVTPPPPPSSSSMREEAHRTLRPAHVHTSNLVLGAPRVSGRTSFANRVAINSAAGVGDTVSMASHGVAGSLAGGVADLASMGCIPVETEAYGAVDSEPYAAGAQTSRIAGALGARRISVSRGGVPRQASTTARVQLLFANLSPRENANNSPLLAQSPRPGQPSVAQARGLDAEDRPSSEALQPPPLLASAAAGRVPMRNPASEPSSQPQKTRSWSLLQAEPPPKPLWHKIHAVLCYSPQDDTNMASILSLGMNSRGMASRGLSRGMSSMSSNVGRRALGGITITLTQIDVTEQVEAQQHLTRLLEQEHKVLESIYPRHIIEYMTLNQLQQESSTREGRAKAAYDSYLSVVPGGTARMASLATWHPCVTILFADIVGFTNMCQSTEPLTVMTFLNTLYSRFDAMVDIYKVYKVETIGDCFVAAGGLVAYDDDGYKSVMSNAEDPLHAVRAMEFAKAMLRAALEVRMPITNDPVKIRIGLHSGPVMSGVVGNRMPRFCLFGDTVNTASRMESTCRPGNIHVSAATHARLPNETWRDMGMTAVKGKGEMRTYEWAGNLEAPFDGEQLQRVIGLYL